MDIDELKMKLMEQLYLGYFKGEETQTNDALKEKLGCSDSELEKAVDFHWNRSNVKVSFGEGTVELTYVGMLKIETGGMADSAIIQKNREIRDTLFREFYLLSKENQHEKVDSETLAKKAGLSPEEFEAHFSVLESMDIGDTLASGEVLISSQGRAQGEERFD